MECNKDEALRAKQIAESKMQAGDFEGALKFATKSQKLFPDTQNIGQILAVCEVHCAAKNKPFDSGSDMDWYGVLQAHRFADEATIKKQYRKLALLLHPDKNKSAGAEAAFKLIGEANRVLSDLSRRTLFDSKLRVSLGSTAPKVPPHHSNGSSFETKCDGTVRNYPNSFYSPSHAHNSHPQGEQQTFWTSCPHCNTRFQYYKTILNVNLRCQQCSNSYIARDVGPFGVPPGYWSSFSQKEPSKPAPSKEASKANVVKSSGRSQEDKFLKPIPVFRTKCTTGVSKAGVGASKPATSKAKESQTSTTLGNKRARQSTSQLRDDNKSGNGKDMKNTNIEENGDNPFGFKARDYTRRSSRKKQGVSYTEAYAQDGDFESSSKRPRQRESFTSTGVEKREVPASGVGSQNGEVRNRESAPPKESVLSNKIKVGQTNVQRKESSNSDLNDRKSKADNSSPLKSYLPPSSEICCPDPDFSDFDMHKAEDCFHVNQLWAIFDTTDTMPRFYALIKKVYSPFKLQIRWLEPDSDEQCEISWHEAGLPVGCGKFKLGHSQRTADRFMFSHQMHCIKGSDLGTHYLIYPKKGETWAIFRNWDIGWSSDPKKHSEFQFEYVEVLSDFDKNVGIKVTYLGKLSGFVSLFQRTVLNGISLFCVPPNELYRFSHRVPSYRMTGIEGEGVPSGSFELDPAGLPSSFFEVDTRESNDAERVSQNPGRSPRSNQKCKKDGQANTSQYTFRKDDKNIGRDYSQSKGTVAASHTSEEVKTPHKHERKDYNKETLNARKSPRDLRKKNAQEVAGEQATGKLNDNHSNSGRNVKASNIPQSVGSVPLFSKEDRRLIGTSTFDFSKENPADMFQCGQIWAIYGGRDHMPNTYAQIKKIDRTPNFRLQVSLLEACLPPKDFQRPVSCGTFKVKEGKPQTLPPSAFSHQLKTEPIGKKLYEIYPKKGQIWALFKDQNYELTSSNQGRGECHIVEVLEDSDKSFQVVVLMPHSSSQLIYRTPRIQRSKIGVIEILREEVSRFSHQIPAFQHSGEDNIQLRGCWELHPSSVPGFYVQID